MSLEFNYPYIPDVSGIQFKAILKNSDINEKKGIIYGGSGRKLQYTISKDLIEIADCSSYRELEHILRAKRNMQNFISFDINTRKTAFESILPEEPHPDMFAGKFVSLALNYLSATGEVAGCKGIWYPWSVNFDQFSRNYAISGDIAFSLKNTWSGKQFVKNGFTNIKNLNNVFIYDLDGLSKIEAVFTK